MTAPSPTSGSPPYFQILDDSGTKYGKNISAGSPNIRPGHVVELQAGGTTVRLCPTSGSPFGQAYGARSLIYTPMTEVFSQGEYLAVGQGDYLCLLSAYFWDTGVIPTAAQAGAPIFNAANGLVSLTQGAGATQIGRFIRQKTVTQLGGQVAIALCRMSFSV